MLAAALGACLIVADIASAQGSAEDYARAASLRGRTEGTVRGADLNAHWIDDHRLWFATDQGNEGRHYVLVNAATGERGPLFDQPALAASLAGRLGAAVDSARLPLDRIAVVDEGILLLVRGVPAPLLFRHGDADSGPQLEDAPPALSDRFASNLRDRPARSVGTGTDTTLRITNATANEIRLLWIDPQGGHHTYGSIAPGATRDQHTFAGHAWVLRDVSDRPLGWVVASEEVRVVVVPADAKPVESSDGGAGGSRRRRRGSEIGDPGDAPPMPAGLADPVGSPGVEAAPAIPEIAVRGSDPTIEFDGPNVVIRDGDGKVLLRSDDGTEDNPYVPPAHWSPDRGAVLVMRRTVAEPHPVTIVESSPRDQVQPKVHTFDYQKPGDRIAESAPRLFDVRLKRAIPLTGVLPEHPWSLDHVHWAPDSSRVFLLDNERGHQVMRVLSIDVSTGASTAVVDERCATFFDYAGKLWLEHLDTSDELLWMSERDGWNHLYLIDRRTGDVRRQLTNGPWVVRKVESLDREHGTILARVGGIHPDQDPYHEHWVSIPIDGGNPTILTTGDGTHRVTFAPGGSYYLDTWSRVDQPPVTELRRGSDGSLIMELGRADWSSLLATGWRPPERFAAKGRDGRTDIWGVIWTPTTFDPALRYPVIEDIYAGPQSSFVPKSFRSMYQEQELAELGFVVVQIDGMGTSNRSKAFHDVCWKNLKDAGFPDRVAWLRAAAATRPWMDLSRVGIYGGSAGGQNALRGLLDYPEVYKVGVADCGCHDNRMDKIWWNELWMSWPVDESYAASSNVTDAGKLQGKLLLVVGELDRNVDPASTMQVVNALIKADKDFDLLVIPGAGHGSAESPYGRRRRADFFVRHLFGVEPRWTGGTTASR